MDECKNKFSFIWSSIQFLCFLIKLFTFTIFILVSFLISLSTNLESKKSTKIWWNLFLTVLLNDIEGFGGDFTFVIYKAFDKGLQCPNWAKKDYLQQCSKTLQVRTKKQNWNMIYKFSMNKFVLKQLVVNSSNKCHFGKPRKVAIAILPTLEIKRGMKNLLRTRSNKGGQDCHLQRMMGNYQKRENPTQIGFGLIYGLPLLL